jgi:acyl carrier protein
MRAEENQSTKDQLRVFLIQSVLDNNVPEDFNNKYDLLKSGVLDSLGIMELVSYLEENYRIDVGFDEVVSENFGNIDNLAKYVHAKQTS